MRILRWTHPPQDCEKDPEIRIWIAYDINLDTWSPPTPCPLPGNETAEVSSPWTMFSVGDRDDSCRRTTCRFNLIELGRLSTPPDVRDHDPFRNHLDIIYVSHLESRGRLSRAKYTRTMSFSAVERCAVMMRGVDLLL